jgi:hypothetical protein
VTRNAQTEQTAFAVAASTMPQRTPLDSAPAKRIGQGRLAQPIQASAALSVMGATDLRTLTAITVAPTQAQMFLVSVCVMLDGRASPAPLKMNSPAYALPNVLGVAMDQQRHSAIRALKTHTKMPMDLANVINSTMEQTAA